MKSTLRACLLALGILTAATVHAHHSAASYNMEKRVELRGTIKSIVFRNPHSEMVLSVAGSDGKVSEWQIETSAANLLRRRGWVFDRIKEGLNVTVIGFPYKSGEQQMFMLEMVLPDGTRFSRPDNGNTTGLD